jgi:hypothetical protein
MSFENIQEILHGVSSDLKKMETLTNDRTEDLMGILDDLAASIMATQSVVSSLAKTNNLGMAEVENWLKENMDQEGQGSGKALTIAKYLVTGEDS